MRARTLLSIILFLSSFSSSISNVQAQDQPPKTTSTRGKVFGTIQDADTKKPLGFANVVLLTTRDSSLVSGATRLGSHYT